MIPALNVEPRFATSQLGAREECSSRLAEGELGPTRASIPAPTVPPMIRANGVLKPLEGYEVLRPVDTEDIIGKIMSEKHLKEFELEGEPGFSYTV